MSQDGITEAEHLNENICPSDFDVFRSGFDMFDEHKNPFSRNRSNGVPKWAANDALTTYTIHNESFGSYEAGKSTCVRRLDLMASIPSTHYLPKINVPSRTKDILDGEYRNAALQNSRDRKMKHLLERFSPSKESSTNAMTLKPFPIAFKSKMTPVSRPSSQKCMLLREIEHQENFRNDCVASLCSSQPKLRNNQKNDALCNSPLTEKQISFEFLRKASLSPHFLPVEDNRNSWIIRSPSTEKDEDDNDIEAKKPLLNRKEKNRSKHLEASIAQVISQRKQKGLKKDVHHINGIDEQLSFHLLHPFSGRRTYKHESDRDSQAVTNYRNQLIKRLMSLRQFLDIIVLKLVTIPTWISTLGSLLATTEIFEHQLEDVDEFMKICVDEVESWITNASELLDDRLFNIENHIVDKNFKDPFQHSSDVEKPGKEYNNNNAFVVKSRIDLSDVLSYKIKLENLEKIAPTAIEAIQQEIIRLRISAKRKFLLSVGFEPVDLAPPLFQTIDSILIFGDETAVAKLKVPMRVDHLRSQFEDHFSILKLIWKILLNGSDSNEDENSEDYKSHLSHTFSCSTSAKLKNKTEEQIKLESHNEKLQLLKTQLGPDCQLKFKNALNLLWTSCSGPSSSSNWLKIFIFLQFAATGLAPVGYSKIIKIFVCQTAFMMLLKKLRTDYEDAIVVLFAQALGVVESHPETLHMIQNIEKDMLLSKLAEKRRFERYEKTKKQLDNSSSQFSTRYKAFVEIKLHHSLLDKYSSEISRFQVQLMRESNYKTQLKHLISQGLILSKSLQIFDVRSYMNPDTFLPVFPFNFHQHIVKQRLAHTWISNNPQSITKLVNEMKEMAKTRQKEMEIKKKTILDSQSKNSHNTEVSHKNIRLEWESQLAPFYDLIWSHEPSHFSASSLSPPRESFAASIALSDATSDFHPEIARRALRELKTMIQKLEQTIKQQPHFHNLFSQSDPALSSTLLPLTKENKGNVSSYISSSSKKSDDSQSRKKQSLKQSNAMNARKTTTVTTPKNTNQNPSSPSEAIDELINNIIHPNVKILINDVLQSHPFLEQTEDILCSSTVLLKEAELIVKSFELMHPYELSRFGVDIVSKLTSIRDEIASTFIPAVLDGIKSIIIWIQNRLAQLEILNDQLHWVYSIDVSIRSAVDILPPNNSNGDSKIDNNNNNHVNHVLNKSNGNTQKPPRRSSIIASRKTIMNYHQFTNNSTTGNSSSTQNNICSTDLMTRFVQLDQIFVFPMAWSRTLLAIERSRRVKDLMGSLTFFITKRNTDRFPDDLGLLADSTMSLVMIKKRIKMRKRALLFQIWVRRLFLMTLEMAENETEKVTSTNEGLAALSFLLDDLINRWKGLITQEHERKKVNASPVLLESKMDGSRLIGGKVDLSRIDENRNDNNVTFKNTVNKQQHKIKKVSRVDVPVDDDDDSQLDVHNKNIKGIKNETEEESILCLSNMETSDHTLRQISPHSLTSIMHEWRLSTLHDLVTCHKPEHHAALPFIIFSPHLDGDQLPQAERIGDFFLGSPILKESLNELRRAEKRDLDVFMQVEESSVPVLHLDIYTPMRVVTEKNVVTSLNEEKSQVSLLVENQNLNSELLNNMKDVRIVKESIDQSLIFPLREKTPYFIPENLSIVLPWMIPNNKNNLNSRFGQFRRNGFLCKKGDQDFLRSLLFPRVLIDSVNENYEQASLRKLALKVKQMGVIEEHSSSENDFDEGMLDSTLKSSSRLMDRLKRKKRSKNREYTRLMLYNHDKQKDNTAYDSNKLQRRHSIPSNCLFIPT